MLLSLSPVFFCEATVETVKLSVSKTRAFSKIDVPLSLPRRDVHSRVAFLKLVSLFIPVSRAASFVTVYVQFVTQYQQAGGRFRLRSTTVCGGWQSDPQHVEPLMRGFDQEAAAVLIARIAVHRTETEEVSGGCATETLTFLLGQLLKAVNMAVIMPVCLVVCFCSAWLGFASPCFAMLSRSLPCFAVLSFALHDMRRHSDAPKIRRLE